MRESPGIGAEDALATQEPGELQTTMAGIARRYAAWTAGCGQADRLQPMSSAGMKITGGLLGRVRQVLNRADVQSGCPYDRLAKFYNQQYQADQYAAITKAEDHPFFPELSAFLDDHNLRGKRCLEIGCGRGAFQDAVAAYTGVDISYSAGRYLRKPFASALAEQLPFAESSFDAIWSYAVLEHVPNAEAALQEMRRVLVDGGLLLLAPAWQCRPWAAEGFPVRPYRDFDLRGKLIKASIPVRDSVWFRAAILVPRRALALITFMVWREAVQLKVKALTPNYDHYWMPDSDAVNSIDPFDALLWFVSRGDGCVNYPTWLARMAVRTGAIAIRVTKAQGGVEATRAGRPVETQRRVPARKLATKMARID